MRSKKTPRADLERLRGLFFLIGLALALGLLTAAMEHRSGRLTPKYHPPKGEKSSTTITIPRTFRPAPEVPLKIGRKPDPRAEPVTKVAPKPASAPLSLPTGTASPIGQEPDPGLYTPEVIEVFLVERVARPNACASFLEREEQMDCLNRWLRDYLQRTVEIPRGLQAMGWEETIYLEFVVDEWGRIESAKVLRGEQKALRQACLEALKNLPEMLPAEQSGRPVKMRMKLPVHFDLR